MTAWNAFLPVIETISSLMFGIAMAGCNLIVPPDPPPEPRQMGPDHFAWQDLEITRDYDFIGVERIDCPKLTSTLTGYGLCIPVHLPMGAAVECPLAYPGKSLQFACLPTSDDIPAVYARLKFDDSAKNLEFSPKLGKCTVVGAGPAIQSSPRYPTDPGHKACLFQTTAPYSILRAEDHGARPSGLYLDLTQNDLELDLLKKRATVVIFDAPAALVLDARLLSREDRKNALKDVFLLFDDYRARATIPHVAPQP